MAKCKIIINGRPSGLLD
jgi:hypothetical protein